MSDRGSFIITRERVIVKRNRAQPGVLLQR